VVTVRIYLNLVQAQLAKSLLDDYGIFCALWHENAHLYGRAPFAMPVRLCVDEDQAEQAIHILAGDLERLAQIEKDEGASPAGITAGGLRDRTPWELLAIAFYFLLPAICVLQIRYPVVVGASAGAHYVITRLTVAHFFGWLAIAFAALLIVTYFYMRQAPHTDRNALV
jgi:hypothetical protein